MQIILNVHEDYIAERHIAYFSERVGDHFEIYEVVERTYKHPEAPDDITLTRLEINNIKNTAAIQAAASLLFQHQIVCLALQKETK